MYGVFILQSKKETVLLEFLTVKSEIVTAINNLDQWMKPEHVKKDLANMINSLYIQREPFGVVCVFSSWNYPITVLLQPMAAAIAAGMCVSVSSVSVCMCICVCVYVYVCMYVCVSLCVFVYTCISVMCNV